ncbi:MULTISPECIES: TetR/AcrR family transcriptional regulator [Streptomyces]|uniref:AcrR family transcriptional regulator n=1 Tax=Streptomyces demainii TaxID=588122 RepID=A0ABT9KLH0_9ACTN|nr:MULTISPECIES: TetR family transcriptional regulator [Streptomyces]MBW8089877.1 TetR family transcriptional regulator [Streptomyces hygroscopicus subsp. hygroscopicus]MDN3058598.1 TetR family transcriptional regulator [Streptomyces sp. SRF1]MDP9608362.1 AcrR family transcriptional regulator [Streptomyces demainii]
MSTAPTGPATGPRKRGRPARTAAADGPATRDRILTAARNEFARHGYDKTSIRGIAKVAEVDPALVHHYFGTKERVFEAAIELILAPAMNAPEVVHGSQEGAGERLARFMFGVWENPATRLPVLAVLRSALTNEAAAAVLRGLIERRVLLRMAGELTVPDPEFRAQLAAGHLIGITMLRYVLRMEPIASAEIDDIVAMVGPTLERYLTEN